VLEIPLTDVDHQGKQPLHLSVADVDRDGHPDLLVNLSEGGPIYIYLLDTGKVALRPPTAEEQRRLGLPERAPSGPPLALWRGRALASAVQGMTALGWPG
jgi:hypothetical protein